MPPIVTSCPLCDGVIELASTQLDTLYDCPDCGETFRLAQLEPLLLVYAYDMDEEPQELDESYPRK